MFGRNKHFFQLKFLDQKTLCFNYDACNEGGFSQPTITQTKPGHRRVLVNFAVSRLLRTSGGMVLNSSLGRCDRTNSALSFRQRTIWNVCMSYSQPPPACRATTTALLQLIGPTTSRQIAPSSHTPSSQETNFSFCNRSGEASPRAPIRERLFVVKPCFVRTDRSVTNEETYKHANRSAHLKYTAKPLLT